MKNIITLLLLSISLISNAQYDLTVLEEQVYTIIKEYKLKDSLFYNKYNFSIIIDKKLSGECKEHSIRMFKTTNVYHDKNRTKSSEIVSNTHFYDWPTTTIYSIDSLHIQIINKFFDSPNHKEIIDSWKTHVGVGIYVDNKSKMAWTTIRFYSDYKLKLELYTQ
jgi:hypothetical protein